MKLVEFCQSNIEKISKGTYERLMNDPSIDVLDYECTNNCGVCSRTAFCMIDGKPVAAKTDEQLFKKVEKKLEEDDGLDIFDFLDDSL